MILNIHIDAIFVYLFSVFPSFVEILCRVHICVHATYYVDKNFSEIWYFGWNKSLQTPLMKF